jgi:hypothetical protein
VRRFLLAAVLLGGCAGLVKTTPTSTYEPASTTPAPAAEEPEEPPRSGIAGAVVRDQLLALIGKSPDDAKAALASYGHDGHVWVDMQAEYDADCGAERVCGFDVPESGMGIHDAITLYINPPPP